MAAREGEKATLRDQDARDVITENLDDNVMVLAGAGAGKTYALIERMVASIRTGAADVDRMAAITFTRKAAGEMRGRFFLRLRKEAATVTTEKEAARLEKAVALVDQCFIGTIHSFCGRLLRERPLEAGLAPDFVELETRDEAILRREVWDRFVQSQYVAGDGRLDELDEHGITTEDLYSFFGNRCKDADLSLKVTTTPKPNLVSVVPQVVAFVDEVSAFVPHQPEKKDKLMLALRRARHFVDNHGVETDKDAAVLLSLFDGTLGVTLKHWSDKDVAREIRDDILPQFQGSVVEPALRRWRECAYSVVTQFVNDAVAYYDQARQEEGKVTFQDLLARAGEMLRNSPDVRQYFQRRFKTILVDEFQDTDPIQAEILFYLTGTDVAEHDWRKLSPRAGSLFLVGDDKQSIYRFRRADVAIFRSVVERIAATGGFVIHLTTSFRSLGNLCRWISESFPSIFSTDQSPYQAPFQPLLEYRPSGIDPHCVRKITLPKVYRNSRAAIAELDAERIVGFISAALRGDTPLNQDDDDGILPSRAAAGDFLILTRTTGQLPVYARALERAGIPFDIVGGGRLGDVEEIRAFVTMLECIYEPENSLRFVAYLRGALVGLSDGKLYDFRKAGGRFVMNAPLPERLDSELLERLEQAVGQLAAAEMDLVTLPPGAALERILERVGLLSFSAVHPDGGGSSRAGSLIRLLALVRRHSARGWHWGRIVEDLRDLIDARDYKVEEMTLEMGSDDVVRIMNVHQAKGLQARVVFLADPSDSSFQKDAQLHVSRKGIRPYLSMIISKPKGDYHNEIVAQPEGWEDDRASEERFAAAEEIRLLYVAATRARNLLVVSEYAAKPNHGPWSPLTRFLDDVPELPPGTVAARSSEEGDESSFSSMRDAAAERLERAKEASYSARSISGNDVDTEIGGVSRAGRGRDYGVLMHRLFEEAVTDRLPSQLEEYVFGLVRDAELSDHLGRDALIALERFRRSSLWSEIRGAQKILTEVPLSISEPGTNGDTIVNGIIDLAFLDDAGWHIIDFKTDVAATATEMERLRRKYTPQVRDYARYWTHVTGEVAEYDLWFVHGPAEEDQLALF